MRDRETYIWLNTFVSNFLFAAQAMRPYKTIHAALLSGECMESLLPKQDINYDLRD